MKFDRLGCRSPVVNPLWAVISLCLFGAIAGPAWGVTQLKMADDAPPIALKDVAGKQTSLADFRGRVVVVIFGELYHDKTRQACDLVEKMLREDRFREQQIAQLLVTAQEAKDPEFQMQAAAAFGSFTVLRDPGRQAFGAYQVTVMPSVVVIDKEGRVVVALGGLVPRFGDIVHDALLLGMGRLGAEQFRQTLSPTSQPAATAAGDSAVRAERLASLARQLGRRGMDEMALAKYSEALQLDPQHLSAREELGLLLLKQKRLAEAEKQFRAVLHERPAAIQSALALAFIQSTRGGSELNDAEQTVRGILVQQPTHPRAQYLLGLILQQRGKTEDALASYRKAAELLLDRNPEEREP